MTDETAELPTHRRIRHPWRVAAVAAVVVVLALIALIASVIPLTSETARVRLVAALSDRLQGEVELAELRLRVFPRLSAEGRGLVIRHHGRHDVPPLISIDRFAAGGTLAGLFRHHVANLTLEGLDIQIPPDRNRSVDRGDEENGGGRAEGKKKSDGARTLVIDQLWSTGARLAIIPSEEGKPPKVWAIHDLRMESVSIDRAMPFQATLTNGVPPGEIATRGSFGPWQSGEPGETPLNGTFSFDRADLSVFKGIAGLLSSRGSFEGSLARIEVHGETETPDFEVRTGRHRVALHTKYHALVDGTNGNTTLKRVDASFLGTSIVAKGGVIGKPGTPGRTVTLDVTIDKGRLEDVLQLAVKMDPPMSGGLRMHTGFVLPPGDQDVVTKLRLNGGFSIQDGRFKSAEVQNKINELSQRTRRPAERQAASEQSVSSNFTGTFRLGGGKLSIGEVTFDVPGAAVRLAGSYDLVPETMNFRGTLFTDAKVSQMTTGIKSLLLKIADPFFKKDGGGSAIPITISGTRSNPSFGLDKSRVFSHKDTPPPPDTKADEHKADEHKAGATKQPANQKVGTKSATQTGAAKSISRNTGG